MLTALLRWRAGLEPVNWIDGHHAKTSKFENTKFVIAYSKNLTGAEPEVQLQLDVADVQRRTESTEQMSNVV